MPETEQVTLSVTEAQTLCLNQNIPFFSYHIPGFVPRYFAAQLSGSTEQFRGFENGTEENGFILVPFDPTGSLPEVFIREDIAFTDQTEDGELIRKLRTTFFPVQPVDRDETDSDRELYREQVTSMISALQQGRARKAVLSRSITVPAEGYTAAPVLFEKMVTQYPSAFVFLVSIPGVSTWLGATPEIFLRQTPDTLSSMSLAGTQCIESTPEQSCWGYKELEEQQIVSDYIGGILKNTCGGQLTVTGPYTHRAGNVYHLCTTFECPASLSSPESEQLTAALHPTPAVGGFPKAEALELIRRTERHDRRYYGGYLGPVRKKGTFDLFVNLRSMEVFPDAFRLYVGGGITALSNPDSEWQETELKSQTLLHLFDTL